MQILIPRPYVSYRLSNQHSGFLKKSPYLARVKHLCMHIFSITITKNSYFISKMI